MFWKARCIIAWAFRILGCIFAIATGIGGFIYEIIDPKTFNEVFPPPLGVLMLGLAVFLVLVAFEMIGRLLSWTDPLGNLPRFRDKLS